MTDTKQRKVPWSVLALRVLERVSPAMTARLAAPAMFRTRRPEGASAQPSADTERFVVTSGAQRLAVVRWGKTGPVVLLMHGWNGHAGQLEAFAEPLVRLGFQVVAFDAPGHGASNGTESSIVHFANALEAVLAAVARYGALHGIVAHSFGGAAVAFALSRKPRPENAEVLAALSRARLVFVASPIDIHDFSRGFASMLGLGSATREHLDVIIEQRLGQPLEELDGLRIARRMQAPLLVIHDENDRAVPVTAGKQLVEAWPGATLRLTRGLGHQRILRDPATVQSAIDFVTAGAHAVARGEPA